MKGFMIGFAAGCGEHLAGRCLHSIRSSMMASLVFTVSSPSIGMQRGWIPRRHITYIFSGNPEEFMKEIHKYDVVVVRFGAKWCKPCLEMTPAFEELSEMFSHMPSTSSEITSTNKANVYPSGQAVTNLASSGVNVDVSTNPYSTEVKDISITDDFNNDTINTHMISYRFLNIDINENESLCALHDVRCVPTFCCYAQSGLYGNIEGAHIDQVQALVMKATDEIKNVRTSVQM